MKLSVTNGMLFEMSNYVTINQSVLFLFQAVSFCNISLVFL